ncbi:hypothetical protein CDD83_8575 [Cordyceps sp. RAO-2017]|nr:hypothetical protein CDD83_8575 [Cordyceps sp. RAO-2017]
MEPRSPRPPPRPSRPPTISALVAQAENFTFNANIPFKHWVRAAETLHQEASFAMSDGDYGRAYWLLYRHSKLVLEHMPSHPRYRDRDSRLMFRSLSRRIDSVLDELERLKPGLEDEYEKWEQANARPARQPSTPSAPTSPASYADFAARDPSLYGPARVLDASEHRELAVDLARKELARRDRAKRAARAQLAPPASPTSGHAAHRDGRSLDAHEDDFRRQMEAARRALSLSQLSGRTEGRAAGPGGAHQPIPAPFNYPSIARSRPVDDDAAHRQRRPPAAPAPDRPPKESLAPSTSQDPSVCTPNADGLLPAVPRKLPLEDQAGPPPPASSAPANQPPLPPKGLPVDGPPLPRRDRLTFKPGAYLENGDPIRSVFIPSQLRSAFLDMADDNTRAGLEMCGIICGMPVNNALFVRSLIIPDQRCTSDTCETENEGAIFDYCSSEDLIVLGWIHTHPTQTCFMSSRDLHTHAGYQVMMPESIAIVCAPRFKPSYGIFRLTHPPGLEHILDCKHQDTFHQHSIDNIYRDSEHPGGHVYESDTLPFYVRDLRTKPTF